MTAETSNAREWVLVPRWNMERVAETLERDGDEHGAAYELRDMLAAAPPPAAARGDVRGLVDKLVDAAYQDGMQELDAMSNETLSARSALEQALAKQPAAVDRARFRKAPCYLCGYNGPGYFQPETHPCAALYHAAQRQEPKS